DAAGGAMNDECVSGLEVQRIIDSLDRGESRGGDRPGLPQAQSLRNVADALRRYRDVLGVEAPVGIVPAVGIDLIADLEALHLLTHGGDRAGAVGAEHQRNAECLMLCGWRRKWASQIATPAVS